MKPASWLLGATALGLFLVWSNSFIAIGYLLGGEAAAARTDWITLTWIRFMPAAAVCAVYLALQRRRETAALWRAYRGRLLVCGFLAVPGYNLALYYGQSHGVPAPIASLTTALLPLFVLLLATVFLGERMTRSHWAGLFISLTGMAVVAATKRPEAQHAYSLLVLVVALAPLSWSTYSVISKPVTRTQDPLLWTYVMLTVGTVMVLPLGLLSSVRSQTAALDAPGWAAVLYLSWPCTVLGFALWTWLLRHIQASTLGMAVFLNPPLTTLSKLTLSWAAPHTFRFQVTGQELAGGALALAGVILVAARRGLPGRNAAPGAAGAP